jgi:DNA-binding CsgD family transcriptional regulator
VTALAARDAERVLRFVAEAEDIGGDEPFTPEVLVELGRLVPADWIGYAEKDRSRKRFLLVVERTGDEDTYAGLSAEQVTLPATNAIIRRRKAGYLGALRLSALVTQHELQATPWHANVLKPFGVTDMLNAEIPGPTRHAKLFGFDRMSGTFSDRDVLVLDYLQPHVAQLWSAAQTRRRLRAALAGLETASGSRGVILIGRGGRIEYASPTARRLVREYFAARDLTELPSKLADWLDSRAATTSWQLDFRSLRIDRVGDALLLEESHDALRLTEREREVLALLAQGKTNGEIAEALWITPATVRKHLENLYTKLGVHTRTAAAARFLQVLQ